MRPRSSQAVPTIGWPAKPSSVVGCEDLQLAGALRRPRRPSRSGRARRPWPDARRAGPAAPSRNTASGLPPFPRSSQNTRSSCKSGTFDTISLPSPAVDGQVRTIVCASTLGMALALCSGTAQAAESVGDAIAGWNRPAPVTAFPVKGSVGYGEQGAHFGAGRGGRAHEGQDVFAPAGTPLVARARRQSWSRPATTAAAATTSRSSAATARQTYVYLHMKRPRAPAAGRARARRSSASAPWAAPAPASAITCTSRCAAAAAPRASRSIRCRCCGAGRALTARSGTVRPVALGGHLRCGSGPLVPARPACGAPAALAAPPIPNDPTPGAVGPVPRARLPTPRRLAATEPPRHPFMAPERPQQPPQRRLPDRHQLDRRAARPRHAGALDLRRRRTAPRSPSTRAGGSSRSAWASTGRGS